MTPKAVERVCACGCGEKFTARIYDVKRGWGRFATKRCKAREQERRTHQHANRNRSYRDEIGWDAHKDVR